MRFGGFHIQFSLAHGCTTVNKSTFGSDDGLNEGLPGRSYRTFGELRWTLNWLVTQRGRCRQ